MALILDGTDGITSSGGTNVLQDDAVITANIADGAVIDAKIAAMAAAKLTGQVPDANAPSGSVIQVVHGTTTTQVEASYSSATDLGLSVSITPLSASNKILVIVQCAGCGTRNTTTHWRIILRRDATNLITFAHYIGNSDDSGAEAYPNTAHLDSPNTTASVSYNLIGIRMGGTSNCYFNHAGPATSTIVAMEIAA